MTISPREDEHRPEINPATKPDSTQFPSTISNGYSADPLNLPEITTEEEFLLSQTYGENSEPMVENHVATEKEEVRPSIPPAKEMPVWRNRNFLFLWIAQALSQTAQNTLNLTLVVYVGKLTNDSPTQTAIATVCFLLPGVFFSAIAGVFVDRFRKRTTLITTNLIRALIVPWLFLMSGVPLGIALPVIYFITIVFSTISQFFNPAEAAAIPILVKPAQLTRANSLFQITIFATLFLGTSLLGPLLPDLIGAENVFLLIASLYFICVGLVWALPNNEEIPARVKRTSAWKTVVAIFRDVYEAWHFIRKDSQIWLSIIYLSTVQSVLFTMTAIGIPFVGDKGLRQSSNTIIFVLAPLSIGLGIAVILVNRLVTERNRMKMLVRACAGMGIIMMCVGFVKPVADLWVFIFSRGLPIGGPGLVLMLIGLSLPFGFSIGLLNIPALTVLQERSPKEIVGRVFAAYFTFANAVSIVPILFAGALGDIFAGVFGPTYGIVPVFFIFGAAVVLVAYYGYKHSHNL